MTYFVSISILLYIFINFIFSIIALTEKITDDRHKFYEMFDDFFSDIKDNSIGENKINYNNINLGNQIRKGEKII